MATGNKKQRLGWIGTGVMGRSLCGHLLEKGYALTVFSRTRAKAQPLLDRGATWAESPRAVAAQAEVVFTMVGFPQDVRAVYFGADGILAAPAGTTLVRDRQDACPTGPAQADLPAVALAKAGACPTILVDMTTTAPSLAREIYAAARARGIQAVDAPVSGGDVGARQATLSIMVGGDPAAVAAVRPLLELLGKTIVHQGGAGAGQHAKLCNQIVIAGTMIGVCESLLYGYQAGLDLETMLQSIRGGAAGCWTLDNLAPRILQRNFEPGFFVEHFLKDMSLALAEAERMPIALPGLALVHQLYRALQAHGHGRCGTQALMLALEQLAGVTVAAKK